MFIHLLAVNGQDWAAPIEKKNAPESIHLTFAVASVIMASPLWAHMSNKGKWSLFLKVMWFKKKSWFTDLKTQLTTKYNNSYILSDIIPGMLLVFLLQGNFVHVSWFLIFTHTQKTDTVSMSLKQQIQLNSYTVQHKETKKMCWMGSSLKILKNTDTYTSWNKQYNGSTSFQCLIQS